jgi:hypothetical protein
MDQQAIQFEEGKECPIQITGMGGGLSFSPSGDMLFIANVDNPGQEQIDAWDGKWRTKLFTESEFPAIPLFAIGSENWIIEAPCNPTEQEKETPGYCEALYAKEDYEMGAILVDATTHIIKKITRVELDEMFVERMVMSWNPFRGTGDQYTKSYNQETFNEKITELFKMKTTKQMWMSSW